MKKAIISLFVLIVAVGFLLLLYTKRTSTLGESKASELAPSDTVAFLEVSDLQRSRVRWRETALYQIIHEPEVQAFLEKPRSKIPVNEQVSGQWDHAKKLEIKEVFLAVTTITDKVPKFVAGFDYKGSKSDAEALVAGLKTELKNRYPAGKSDITKYGAEEIETFDFDTMRVASVFKGPWFFVADDIDLLKATLDRLDGKVDAKTSLRQNAAYKASLSRLPQSSDVAWFVQPQALAERLGMVMAMTDPNFNPKQLDALKKIQAVAGGMKLDGEKIRDAMYVYNPGAGKQPPMARNSMAFTTPETMAYYTAVLEMSGAPKLPDPALDSTGLLAALDGIRQALESAGLTYGDFKAAFGPEIGVILGWPRVAMQPSLLFTLDARDGAKAQKFLDTLLGGQAGLPAWGKQEIAGAHFYSLPQQAAGFIAVTPVVALTDKSLLFGLSLDAVQNAVEQARTGGDKLDKNPGFQAAAEKVGKPAKAFAFIDSKALFDKVYGLGSNMLRMMAMLNSHANDYADLGKLPSTETISRHLSPIVYSQSGDEDGMLIESTGPVTFSQAAFAVGVGMGISAVLNSTKQLQHRAAPASTPQLPLPAGTP